MIDLAHAIDTLLAQPAPVLAVNNAVSGQPVAYIVRLEAMPDYLLQAASVTRPRDVRDLPRAARPKTKLSKRQRDNAKRERLRPATA